MDIAPVVEFNLLIDEAIVVAPNKPLPLPDTMFDLVVSNSVDEHLDDPAYIARDCTGS